MSIPAAIEPARIGVFYVKESDGKQSRQWRMIRELENTHFGLSVTNLVDRIEGLTQRTAYRDLKDIIAAGFDLERVGVGKFRAVSATLKSMPLQSSQVVALGVAIRFLEGTAPWLAEPLRELYDLLEVHLGDTRRQYCKESVRGFSVPKPQNTSPKKEGPHPVETFHSAVEMEQKVTMRYRSRQGVSTYQVHPYGVCPTPKKTYLIGRLGLKEGFRKFVADRVLDIRIRKKTFERDPSFDLEAYLAEDIGGYGGPMYDYELELKKDVSFLVHERVFGLDQQITWLEDGGVRVNFRGRGLPVVAAEVASYGGEMVAHAPCELIQWVVDIHRKGLRAQEEAVKRGETPGDDKAEPDSGSTLE